MNNTDVAIVGAGPAGLSLASSLSGKGLKITVFDKLDIKSIEKPAPDGREIALTHLSLRLMKESGTWAKIPEEDISLIEQANVLDGRSDFKLNFNSQKSGLDALGYMVPNFRIREACYKVAAEKSDVDIAGNVSVVGIQSNAESAQVTLDNGRVIKSQLVIGADSRFSHTRRMMGISADLHDFGRSAIVCRMRHEKSHKATASECFNYGHTLAILPLQEHVSSVVMTVKSPESKSVMALSDEAFSLDIAQRFAGQLGKMELIGERFEYPLVATYANRFYAQRFALIGDAAVGMHPVTAHGFNLGLRSQDILSTLIDTALANQEEIGSEFLLKRYNRLYRNVSRPLYLGTNGIVRLYTDDRPPAKMLRTGLLRISQHLSPLKQLITRQLTENRL